MRVDLLRVGRRSEDSPYHEKKWEGKEDIGESAFEREISMNCRGCIQRKNDG